MKKALVGYTGFVGSNLCRQTRFDGLYNSKNIEKAYGTRPDLLYYAGVPRQKFIADRDPRRDLKVIENAARNIEKIRPGKLVLISTVDVYGNHRGLTEEDGVPRREKPGYGANRRKLEIMAQSVRDCLVVRLPGLYGKNLKKNFIYDYINFIPSLLSKEKLRELGAKEPELLTLYTQRDNGYFCPAEGADRENLRKIFKRVGFSALNFTDSRSVYQYYGLSRLSRDIDIALGRGLSEVNLMTRPVETGYLYRYLTGEDFVNHILNTPLHYDIRTCHARLFGGKDGYICDSRRVCRDIKEFVEHSGEESK